MNKKLVLSCILWVSLLITSCSTKKLWTFEEEIKAEQNSYAENINSVFSSMDWYYEWKFSQTWDLNLDLKLNNVWDLNVKSDFTTKTISLNDEFSFDSDLKITASWSISENVSDPEFKDFASSKLKASSEIKLWLVNWVLYGNIKDANFDLDWKGDLKNSFSETKKQFDFSKSLFIKKWYSFELPEEILNELKKSVWLNKKSFDMFREFLTQFIKWDIFTKAELTQYEWKEAYKFSIDEKKALNHFYIVAKNISEKYGDVLLSYWLTKEDIENKLKEIEKMSNEYDASKDKRFITELYLTRSTDWWANIILTKFRPIGESEENNLFISILEDSLNISISKPESKLDISFKWDKSGKVIFNWNFKILSNVEKTTSTWTVNELELSDISKFSWEFFMSSKSLLKSWFKLDLDVLKQKNWFDVATRNWMNLKLDLKSETKKDNSLLITKESVTEKSTEIFSLSDLMNGFLNSINAWNMDYESISTWATELQ